MELGKLSQTDRLYNLLSDGKPHNTIEILRRVYGLTGRGIARISARIYDIKKQKNKMIDSWRDPNKPTVYWYQMQ